jgi:hypothetical protein
MKGYEHEWIRREVGRSDGRDKEKEGHKRI